MKFEEITEKLKELLEKSHYSPNTIKVYEREWRKISSFLQVEYGNTLFDMDRGLKYLEKQYGLISHYNDGTLSQQRVQLLRIIHMLEDYRIHNVLTQRFYSSKNPIRLNGYFKVIHNEYSDYLDSTELSATTNAHYLRTTEIFLDYISQIKLADLSQVTLVTCYDFINTLTGFSFKTIEQHVCGLRHFLRFLNSRLVIKDDYAQKIHMPNVSKNAKIPSAWNEEELRLLLESIERNSPIGKRDYAMILLACVLGLRVSDIKNLSFSNFNWEEKCISLVQHKTHKPLTLPLPDVVGWAVIDYIQNGRPHYYDTDIIFVKHMPPFDPIGDSNHMAQIIVKYMRKAGIDRRERKRSGFHSLRHSTGSMLLEMNTPLPVITNILGHSDPDITAIYLKTDLKKLMQCVLVPEEYTNG